jgi:hypothetical protein
MNDRASLNIPTRELNITAREQQRREIARQVEMFLQGGGNIDVLGTPRADGARPIGPVWWDSRGSGSLPIGF